jgi:hypothetical protein
MSIMKKAVMIQTAAQKNETKQSENDRLLSLRASSMNPSSNLVWALKASPMAIRPVGKKSNTARPLTQRQSFMRRGIFGLYFCRRLTVFIVLPRETADVAVFIVAVLVYSGFVGLICGYSSKLKKNFI